ncbi:MAG: tRNA epoxyqueuosine(34) reductase QueG [Gammaproteobacteria bacterium]|nr:tRNA epoxyqueuosine(34) reductase QueG [Gammaproteobacteria bacterium]
MNTRADLQQISIDIKRWGRELGFQQTGIAGISLEQAENRLSAWLKDGFHGGMDYMMRHGLKRSRPALLEPGTLRVISARMDYLPENVEGMKALLKMPRLGYISRYSLGRDYHKLLRKRLAALAKRIQNSTGEFPWRAFADSAPVLEKPLAQQAGLGWAGKHTNLICREAGSWFFLGELYIGLPLPVDEPASNHCGRCRACIDICPTRAIIAPYRLDARRCISYLTIELRGAIPTELRPLLGNRIYGCDDCQMVCPWNRFARITREADFLPRSGFDAPRLTTLFKWSEEQFLRHTEGSAIRRITHIGWLRNIAVALGNGPFSETAVAALHSRTQHPSALVREHVAWALDTLLMNYEL